MPSKSEICNLSLSHCGISQFVTNVETEDSLEAIVCRTWYDIVVEAVLRDFDWNCARRRKTLGLLTQTPPDDWAYTYEMPSDCLMARRIAIPGNRNPASEFRIPFEVAIGMDSDPDAKVIYTDQAEAVLVYTKRLTDPTLFDAQLVVAISYFLTAHIVMPLAVKPQLADQARVYYTASKSNARKSDLNEGQVDIDPASETETVRS